MKYIHVSPVYNRVSILKNGIIPTRVDNYNHLKSFRKDNACVDDKAIYVWHDCDKNEKYVKDLIFAKVWIHPRNDMYREHNDFIDFSKFHRDPIYLYDQMIYDIYEIDTDCDYHFVHAQTNDVERYNTCYGMMQEYEHDDKLMSVLKTTQRNIRIVGHAEYHYSNKRINIKVV